MNTRRIQHIIRICIWIVPVFLFAWIVDRNFVLMGTTTLRCTADGCDPRLKGLGSREREVVTAFARGTKQAYRMFTADPFSFDTKLFRPVARATVRLVYKGGSAGNRASLTVSTRSGKDEVVELADSTALTSALESSWDAVRSGEVVLFQKRGDAGQRYAVVEDFLKNIPTEKKIGEYDVDLAARLELPGYVPAAAPTVLPVQIRGAQTLETYIGSNEDLNITLAVQNSNRNPGKDDLSIKVSRGIDLMKSMVLKDTGAGKGDGKPSEVRDVAVVLPNPGPGTYRIELSASDDIFIRTMTTRQRYLIWNKKLYLAGSREYRALGATQDLPVTVYVKGTTVTASTAHDNALQTITVGGKKLDIVKKHSPFSVKLPSSKDFVPVVVPTRDIQLTTDGVFVLSKDQSFFVTAKNFVSLTGTSDPSELDYVVAKYAQIGHEGDWLVAEKTITADLGRSVRYTISFDPPLSAGALRMKELEVKVVGGPITFTDIKRGLSKLLHGGL